MDGDLPQSFRNARGLMFAALLDLMDDRSLSDDLKRQTIDETVTAITSIKHLKLPNG